MIESKDPYKGMKYSEIIAAEPDKFRERPHPLRKVAGTGKASWDATIGRYVV